MRRLWITGVCLVALVAMTSGCPKGGGTVQPNTNAPPLPKDGPKGLSVGEGGTGQVAPPMVKK